MWSESKHHDITLRPFSGLSTLKRGRDSQRLAQGVGGGCDRISYSHDLSLNFASFPTSRAQIVKRTHMHTHTRARTETKRKKYPPGHECWLLHMLSWLGLLTFVNSLLLWGGGGEEKKKKRSPKLLSFLLG